jgi:hypothetical protein
MLWVQGRGRVPSAQVEREVRWDGATRPCPIDLSRCGGFAAASGLQHHSIRHIARQSLFPRTHFFILLSGAIRVLFAIWKNYVSRGDMLGCACIPRNKENFIIRGPDPFQISLPVLRWKRSSHVLRGISATATCLFISSRSCDPYIVVAHPPRAFQYIMEEGKPL